MAYQTGTSTDPVDLLDKLRLFAIANGFTVNNYGARPAGATAGQALQITKGGSAWTFLSNSAAGSVNDPGPMVGAYGHDAYSAGGGTETQANKSPICWANAMGGPYQAYHFFCDNGGTSPPYLYLVAETAAGVFKHVGAGRMDTLGTVTTGQFVHGGRWNYQASPNRINTPDDPNHSVPFDSLGSSAVSPGSSVRADSDGFSPRWCYEGAAVSYRMYAGYRGSSTSQGPVQGLIETPASGRTGRTVLIPCLVSIERVAGNYSFVGAPRNMRWVQMGYLEPGATLTLGSDTWKVFPVIKKNGPIGTPTSALVGFAYLVN